MLGFRPCNGSQARLRPKSLYKGHPQDTGQHFFLDEQNSKRFSS